MLFANILLLITSFTALCLGLFIILSNSKKGVNRALALFIAGCFIWLLANLLTNISNTPKEALFFARTTLIGPVMLSYCFLIFAKVYAKPNRLNTKQIVLLAIAPLVLLSTTFTKLNIVSIGAYGRNTKAGPIYALLVPLIIVYFGWALVVLVRYNRAVKNVIVKAQIRYIFVGVILSVIPGLLANGILPLLGKSSAVFYGPNAVILLAIMMSLAIVRHRLLDIKFIVARSFAYVLSISSMALLFTVGAFGLTSTLFRDQGLNSLWLKWVYVALSIILALTFPIARRFFDKVTNRFFYRDAYDTQVFLDDFNKVLVATYELTPLLRRSAEIISTNLKPDYVMFGVKETTGTPRRIIGTVGHPGFTEGDIAYIRQTTPKIRHKIITEDEVDDRFDKFKGLMAEKDISILARLTASVNDEGVGYLVLGPKKSGNPYNSLDLKTLEIITNELVIAIQNALHFEEIQNFNLTLQAKVDEATKKLRRANEKLKEMDETKDDFISMASHQLRTPLTSVKGYLSMTLEGDAGRLNTRQKEMLQQAFFSSQRMVYLIADLLNVSRLKTGKFIIESAPTNLATIVEQELDQLQETAKAKNLTLTYQRPTNFPTLMLDETKIRQVIMNFADNAIYYTPAGGHIEVRLTETPSNVEFRVIDDGIGVPRAEQHHLFTKFYRAGNARKARPDGTGLGLFMAKKVVLSSGGSVIFESQENKGSTFGFSFSKAKLAPAAKPAPEPVASAV